MRGGAREALTPAIVTGGPTTHSVAGVNARCGELEFSEGRH